MDKKLYSTMERDLVFEWADRWFQLGQLIIDLVGTDEPPWSPPPQQNLMRLNIKAFVSGLLTTSHNLYRCGGISTSHRIGLYIRVTKRLKTCLMLISTLRILSSSAIDLRTCTG